MNKMILGMVIGALVVVAVLGIGGVVYAQTATPGNNVPGFGPGMMGARGGRMGGGMGGGRMMGNYAQGNSDGLLHDEMVAGMAEKLGMSAADLDARLDKGERMADIAIEKGWTVEQFSQTMQDVRAQAVDKAVAAGTLTQEQGDWMKQMGAGRGLNGQGGFGGGRGRGAGNCPYLTTPATPAP